MNPEVKELQKELAVLKALKQKRNVEKQRQVVSPAEPSLFQEFRDYLIERPYTGLNVALGLTKGYTETADLPSTVATLTGAVEPDTLPRFTTPVESLSEALLGEKQQLGTQELASYLSPFGLRKLGTQTLSGLGAYVGAKSAEKLAPESLLARILAPLVGGAAPTLTRIPGAVTRGTLTKGESLTDALNIERQAQKEVARELTLEEAQRLAAAQEAGTIMSTVPYPKTLAEVVQSPDVALYQDVIRGKEGGAPILEAMEARKKALTDELEEITPKSKVGELRDEVLAVAEQEQQAQTAIQGKLIDRIEGLEAGTKREAGTALQESLLKRKEEAKAVVDKKWKAVPEQLELDVTDEIDDIFNWYDSLDEVEKKYAPGVTEIVNLLKRTGDDIEAPEYRMTYKRFQGIRAGLNQVIVKGEGTNETRLARELKTKMDEMLGRLDPREEALKDVGYSPSDVKALYEAIDAYRDYSQTLRKGVVGEVTKKRLGDLKVKASTVVDRVLKYPENVAEIMTKFGRTADESLILRQELMKRLTDAKNPGAYLKKNVDLYKEAFDADFGLINIYAKLKQSGSSLDAYTKGAVSDATIANKIFRSEKETAKFVKDFDGTAAIPLAKGKLIDLITKRGDAAKRLSDYENVGSSLFKEDWELAKNVIQDLEGVKSPSRLFKKKTAGESGTQPRQVKEKAIAQGRRVYRWADKAPALGAALGAFISKPFGVTGALAGTAIGAKAGEVVKGGFGSREQRLNKAVASLLADPRMIAIGKKEATAENVKVLDDFLTQIAIGGRGAAISANTEAIETEASEATEAIKTEASEATQPKVKSPELENLQSELALLKRLKEQRSREASQSQSKAATPTATATPTITIEGADYSIPTGEQYASPDLVKAVIAVESSGKRGQVSPKGARGLMQIMPKTAKELGIDPTNPEQNIEGGARYLKTLINRFNNIELALAAYNWGQGNIANALKKLKGEGREPTWENIKRYNPRLPGQTRKYVGKVLSNMRA